MRDITTTAYTYGVIGALFLALAPARAHAQSGLKDNVAELIRKVGVHGNMSVRNSPDPDVTKGTTFGPSIGLSPGRTNGVKYPIGFTMFSENLRSPNGEQFAVMDTKAIMAGIGYGWHFGRLSTGAALQTGYAFNSGRIEGDVLRAFESPAEAVSVHVGNSPFLRPGVKAEYFITPKFTFRVSADYMLMRPNVTVTTPAGQIADRWDMSNVHANIGVGFYPFRR